MVKVDFHTHSVASPDGSITLQQYSRVLALQKLDCIAITDHNRIDFAQYAQKQLGSDKIIVGEEITTTEGEIIGLYLSQEIPAGLSLKATIKLIKEQGGIIYVPHPFETVRKGLSIDSLDSIQSSVDMIETQNGRAFFQNFGPRAQTWATANKVSQASSSDAHRWQGLGRTYTELATVPTRKTLLVLAMQATQQYKQPLMLDIIAPKRNKLVKRLSRKRRYS